MFSQGWWTCEQDESDLGEVDLSQASKSEPIPGQNVCDEYRITHLSLLH